MILEEIKEFADNEDEEENKLDQEAELEFNKEYENLEKKDFEYWDMAQDALGDNKGGFKLRKPKMPEIQGTIEMGEKNFSFAQMEFKSKTDQA